MQMNSTSSQVDGWQVAYVGFLGAVSLILLSGLKSCFKIHQRRVCGGKLSWPVLLDLAKTAYLTSSYAQLRNILETKLMDVDGYVDPESGLTLFLCSCLSTNKDLISFLLERGANHNARTARDQNNALHLATHACCTHKSADTRAIDVLACRGVHVNAVDVHGNTPLAIAALYGRGDLLSLLLQYGADPCIVNSDGVRPVDFAANSGNLEAAKFLEESIKH